MKKTCDHDLTHNLDKLKSLSVKIAAQVVIRDACGTWHSLCTVTSIQKKHKKQPETQRQVSQWMAEDSQIKTERNRVYKHTSLKKKKRDVPIKKLITDPCETI